MSENNAAKRREIQTCILGYACALVLTVAAFAVVYFHLFAAGPTFLCILGLGLVQMIVHFRFFLHIRLAKSSRDGLQLILFTALIIILMVSGTLVILFNLRDRMMPMPM